MTTPNPTIPDDDLIRHGLACGGHHTATADEPEGDEIDDAATQNVTDLRRARAKARSTVAGIMQAIQDYLKANSVARMVDTDNGLRRLNSAITAMASERFRGELISWLVERHRITAGRAARQAFSVMEQAIPGDVDGDDLRGAPYVTAQDREWLRQLRQIDVGLLSGTETATQVGATTDSLAEKLGDRMTRQLRLGVQNNESVSELSRRVELVMQDGEADDRAEKGVSGQTTSSKAELIAHDSVQDAYNTAARNRYTRNGFRYAVFDATIDYKTSDICRRLNEVIVDMVDDPWLLPPLHPYCRSGLRPKLQLGDQEPISRDDIADGYLNTIMQTKSYRPPVQTTGDFQPTALTEQYGQA